MQENGFSPVCVLTCRDSWESSANFFEQCGQDSNDFITPWLCSCFLRVFGSEKYKPHCLHSQRLLECDISCFFEESEFWNASLWVSSLDSAPQVNFSTCSNFSSSVSNPILQWEHWWCRLAGNLVFWSSFEIPVDQLNKILVYKYISVC